MPIDTFRVRHYECDAYGHLNNTVYVHYLTEMALGILEAAGGDPVRDWRLAALELEFLRPFHYRDQVEVHFEPCGTTGPRLRWAFTLRRPYEWGLHTRGWIEYTWQQDAGIPHPIRASLGAASWPTLPPGEVFPPPPPAPAGVLTLRRAIDWTDLDLTLTAGPVAFLHHIEAAGRAVIEKYHWPLRRMHAAGFAIFIRRNRIQLGAPARFEDEFEIATFASDVTRITATRHYLLTRVADGARLARISSLNVWVDLATGKPLRIPAHFIGEFEPNLVR